MLSRINEYNISNGYDYIIGVDEAGRGPLAGPVVAAACYITSQATEDNLNNCIIMDSKVTTESQREETYETLINSSDVVWAVSIVSHTEIDEVNILQATMNGMRRCTTEVVNQLVQSDGKKKKQEKNSTIIDKSKILALIDGNRVPTEMPVESKSVIKGDSSMFSIAAASIIAKVTRDRIMVELDKKYPVYKLAQHKGYPTAEHRALLLQHGASDIHRRSYAPVKKAIELHGIPADNNNNISKGNKKDSSKDNTKISSKTDKKTNNNGKKTKLESKDTVTAKRTRVSGTDTSHKLDNKSKQSKQNTTTTKQKNAAGNNNNSSNNNNNRRSARLKGLEPS